MKESDEYTQDWKLSEDIKTGFAVPENYFKGIENDFSLNLIRNLLVFRN